MSKNKGQLSPVIYIITDGLNESILQRRKADTLVGDRIHEVPQSIRWVVGHMMLGVLSTGFIGNPTSTLSGNIARGRVAPGFDAKTNYLRL